MTEFLAMEVQVVGPRPLPADGPVRVWVDSGSGWGHNIEVAREYLVLSRSDDGQGSTAIYDLAVFFCRG